MHFKSPSLIVLLPAFLVLMAGCKQVTEVFETASPRENYVKEIQKSPLAENKVVQRWIAAGDSVLEDPVPMNMPFQTKVIYFSDEANAWAWQMEVPEGRMLRARLATADTTQQLFMELFTVENGEAVLEESLSDSLISYIPDEPQTLVLRMQAELLINGSATLTVTDNPSMEFPVQDGMRVDIGSFWGDPRDGGRRQHEGIDIFADRGTPAVAAAEGRVTRTGNGGLGGKTVWLRANGKALYYAHLDSINTHMGAGVQIGDTLGFVGNTGNARTTPPHLHFGIYDRGAVDPLPFIDFANIRPEPITADPSTFPKWGRVSAAKANVRPLPSTKKDPIVSLNRNNPVQVLSGTGEWYHVVLPDGRRGFIFQSLVEPASTRLREQQLASGDWVYDNFESDKPFFKLSGTEFVDSYGSFKSRQLAKIQNRWVWVE